MEAFRSLFAGPGIATTILYLSITAFTGILLGRINVKNLRLGVAGVLFSGLLLAHFGVRADLHVLTFVRDFGLILLFMPSVLMLVRGFSAVSGARG